MEMLEPGLLTGWRMVDRQPKADTMGERCTDPECEWAGVPKHFHYDVVKDLPAYIPPGQS